MRRILFLFLILAGMVLASCSESEPTAEEKEHTVVMLFPWGNNTYSHFLKNISQMETAIASRGSLGTTDLIVWIANSRSSAMLIRIETKHGQCVRDTLKTYAAAYPSGADDYTTDDGLASLIGEIKRVATTSSYSFIIGSHGTGALPRGCDFETATAKARRAKASVQTRWWGATSALPDYCIDVASLAYALEQNAVYADYIYFDACYMGNVETAYLLRNATRYLMASPAELLIAGSPYETVGARLLDNDYRGALDAFVDYYNSTTSPYGTMSLIDCSKLDNLAATVKEICSSCTLSDEERGQIQAFDGLSQHVFFDLSDYISRLHPTAEQLAAFSDAMAEAVPYRVNTQSVISMYSDDSEIKLNSNSGLSTTMPTQNQNVRASQSELAWWIATHE